MRVTKVADEIPLLSSWIEVCYEIRWYWCAGVVCEFNGIWYIANAPAQGGHDRQEESCVADARSTQGSLHSL